jgi:hypothetical protein
MDAGGHVNCDTDRAVVVNENEPTEILYTYSVEWRVSPTGILMVVFLHEMGNQMG